MLKIPEIFQKVHYVASRIPGVDDQQNLSFGANCQVFAYAFLWYYGKFVPNYRSSELWADDEYTEEVTEFKPFDILLYHDKQDAYGAHVGVYVGQGRVLHLSKDHGIPKIERHHDLLKQKKYSCFIGAKRILNQKLTTAD